MEFSYDKKANALSLRFSVDKVASSDEIADGIIVDYNTKKKLIAIEILDFTSRSLNLNDLIQLTPDEVVPMILQCQ